MSTAIATEPNPIVILADKIEHKPYLTAFLRNLRQENSVLPPGQTIKYAICSTSAGIAPAMRWHRDNIKMILIGPGLQGNAWTVARMLCRRTHVVMVVDAAAQHNLLYQQIKDHLESLGILMVTPDASEAFFKPVVRDYLLSGERDGNDLRDMSPQERAEVVEKRLEAVDRFPSLPETQRRVAELDDLDPPRKWAVAIDPDVLARTVILRTLNSAYYGFRSRVSTIEQAVVLASARTLREIVLACQIRQLFAKISEKAVEQFWRHSLAVGFFAKLFTLPADSKLQTPAQRVEFSRFRLEEPQVRLLRKAQLWEKLALAPKEDAFTCGLLHDIGKITMLLCLEDSLELLLSLIEAEVRAHREQGELWAQSTVELEQFLMQDIDHQVIGYYLARRWGLDEKVCEVIGFHHDLEKQSSNLMKLIGLADLAANTLFPYPATEEQHPLPQLFERVDKIARKKPGKTAEEGICNAFGEVRAEWVEVLERLGIPHCLWETIDFRDFFHLCYRLAPKLRATTIGFLQQTAI